MSALTQEQYNGLDDGIKPLYVSTEGGYEHGGFLKMKESLNAFDTKYKTIEGELNLSLIHI